MHLRSVPLFVVRLSVCSLICVKSSDRIFYLISPSWGLCSWWTWLWPQWPWGSLVESVSASDLFWQAPEDHGPIEKWGRGMVPETIIGAREERTALKQTKVNGVDERNVPTDACLAEKQKEIEIQTANKLLKRVRVLLRSQNHSCGSGSQKTRQEKRRYASTSCETLKDVSCWKTGNPNDE